MKIMILITGFKDLSYQPFNLSLFFNSVASCQSKEEEESKNIVKTNVETKKQKKERKKELSAGDEVQTKKKHKKLKKEKHKT